MHPKNQAGAVRIGIRIEAKLRDLIRRRQQGFEDSLQREPLRIRKRARDLARDPADPVWKDYCPNAQTLTAFDTLPWMARREW